MAYAFILALTGPAKNTLHNTGVLSESLACGQEQLKEAVKTIVDLVKQPFYALKTTITKVIKSVRVVVKKIKATLIALKKLVISILKVIKNVFQWLGSIVNVCNKKLGTPFERCQKVFEGAVADCRASLGPLFGGICNLAYVVGLVCYAVKPFDFICMLVSYVADTIVGSVQRKLEKFTKHMAAMFYVKVKFSHDFHFETNQSKSLEEISTGIVTEIRSRTDKFLTVFDWMSFATSFFILFMLLRVIHYRHKWLTNERFDNRYLTDDLREIDLRRSRENKETVLPLNPREKSKYIPLTSITLVRVEKIKLTKSAVFLSLTTFKLCIHMMADYSLYWVLSTIRYHGRFETKIQRPNSVGIIVTGNGYLADLYRSIISAFSPMDTEMQIDSMPCLPDPVPPDLDRYTQIISLIVFCWIMAVFEPYGLRLRHVVMSYYHPDRAKQRAVWLYNHIIRSRSSFLKFARRQLRRKFGMAGSKDVEQVTLRERFAATCPIFGKYFRHKENLCLLCGSQEREDNVPHIKCPTPGCVGLFCVQCFADLQNTCTICKSPLDYGDLSDMSEEKDSSDMEDFGKIPRSKELKSTEEVRKDEMTSETELLSREDNEIKKELKDAEVEQMEDDFSSDSSGKYSYGYQEGPPTELDLRCQRIPYRDIEAQKVRDDVTIQIFNEPISSYDSSGSVDPTSCFMIRARRKLRAKLKRKSISSPRKESSSSSTSIADTESLPTEEIDEEEVIQIEVEDKPNHSYQEGYKSKEERKLHRTKKIIAALSKVSWLGGKKGDSKETKKEKKPSLMKKIVNMLCVKQSAFPLQTYRRIRTVKSDTEEVYEQQHPPMSSSSSTVSLDDYEETRNLLDYSRSRHSDELSPVKRHSSDYDEDYCKTYDSHRDHRRKMSRRHDDNHWRMKYPHERKFPTRELPRHLKSISEDTIYTEIDEKNEQRFADVGMSFESSENISNLNTQRTPRIVQCRGNIREIEEDNGDEISLSNSDRKENSTFRGETEEYVDVTGLSSFPSDQKLYVRGKKRKISELNYLKGNNRRSSASSRRMSGGAAERKAKRNRKGSDFDNRKKKVDQKSDVPDLYDPYAGLELLDERYSSGPKNYAEDTKKSDTDGRRSEGKSKKHKRQKIRIMPSTRDEGVGSENIKDTADSELDEKSEVKPLKMDKSTDLPDRAEETQTQWSQDETEMSSTTRTEGTSTWTGSTDDKYVDATSSRRKRKRRRKRRDRRRGKKSRDNIDDYGEYYCELRTSPSRNLPTRSGRKEDSRKMRSRASKKQRKNVGGTYERISDNETRPRHCSEECRHLDYHPEEKLLQHRTTEDYTKLRHDAYRCDFRYDSEEWHDNSLRCLCETNRKILRPRVDYRRSRNIPEVPVHYPPRHQRYETRNYSRKHDIPVLRKYLPMFQTPGLIEELKEHDRIKLIQAREVKEIDVEARRDSPGSPRLTEEESPGHREAFLKSSRDHGHTLPYQETQAFKDLVHEYRQKAQPEEDPQETEPLVSASEDIEGNKDVKQLFPKEEKKQKGSTISKITNKILRIFKSSKQKTQRKCRGCSSISAVRMEEWSTEDQLFTSESASEMSSPVSQHPKRKVTSRSPSRKIGDTQEESETPR
ncbi:uncharacterized protein LOC105696254 isoform X2 [Orussus abietinus]|nr:uncharacterized protein LOC105696254 isoform X2 [Orussus abietinus]